MTDDSEASDPTGPEAEPALWSRLRAGDAAARTLLVQRYLPHARRVAATYYRRRVHDEIGFDDYLQLALLGMMESLDRFDPALGIRFGTYSSRRMHGAILDGLDRMTEKQQQIAARRRVRKERLDSLVEPQTGQAPIADPLPGQHAAQTEALFRYLAEVGVGLALSFMLEGTGMFQQDDGDRSSLAGETAYYRRTELRQLREKLLAHVDGLRPQARQVIRWHYVQAMPFEAIAESMGLTKGRVSQIHREALLHLRHELKAGRSSDLVC